MTEIVRTQGLTLRYPYTATATLRDLSFRLTRGDRVLLLGPSGSGKSSLSLCLNGLIPHSVEAELDGSLRVFGKETRHTEPARQARQVGIVFQDPESQFCTLTVEDEIAFGLENLKLSRSEIDDRIGRALGQVGLSGERHTRLDRLSGGMKQRIALAAALAMDPELLILDEATANLDPAGAADMFDLVGRLVEQDPDRTFLIVEHRLDRLMPVINRVWALDGAGHLIHDAPPRRFFAEHSQQLETAGIWQPTASRLAYQLQQAGITLPWWPLTMPELLELLSDRPETWPVARAWAKPGAETPVSPAVAPAAELKEVTFAYSDGTRAVENLSLSVRQGEILALLGANGAGKTTLAHLLVGLLRPQQGMVRILNEDTGNLSVRALARRCGFVFQNPEHQFVTDQVFEEVAFGLRQQGLNEETVHAQVEDLLGRLGLGGKHQANPFELSQGQKRRLSVATMLDSTKALLVLDEPTFGQDARNIRELVAELRRLHREGLTLVLVTHDMDLVWSLAQRAAVMANGRLLKVGPVPEIFNDTALLHRAHLKPPPQAVTLAAVSKNLADGEAASRSAVSTAVGERNR